MIIGVLGGGQLGRMLALAGLPLGCTFRTLDPAPDVPMAALATHIQGAYADPAALDRFAAGLDLVTYEFENVPVAAAERLAARVPIFPPPLALEVAQDRLREKEFLQRLGIPTAPFAALATDSDLPKALAQTGLPAVLKTRRGGYDGKGQWVVRTVDEAVAARRAAAGAALIVEGWVPFTRELSILAVRGWDGALAFYPLVENTHRGGILRQSRAPAPDVSPALQAQAEGYARAVLVALDYVGVAAIELFQVGPTLVANELAPRVHNSGHWTIEGAATSQFANHLRAGLGLPLGDPAVLGPAAMVNLIGTLPHPAAVLGVPGAALHLYGKVPRPGRKLGHITLRAADAATLDARLARLATLLPGDGE